ncbi:MAG: outer membrane lipoprotein carrier protein LolA [Planctomycetaceae bacterium]|nr:outer membrane lipoprotein carrier protein LolA [Planctomycetaceae bacterium]
MPALAILLVLGCAAAQDSPEDAAAKAALQKLAEQMKDVRTLTADVVQSRKTELLDKPIVSSGRMAYRREPARLVFHLNEPRKAEIHLDKSSYQVYRPDEKRLERIDFGSEDVSTKILMVFEPKTDDIGKAFAVKGGERKDGAIEVRLESTDPKFLKRMKKIALTIVEADGSLRRIAYTDAEGDEVQFDLSKVVLNPELPADEFVLRTPDGTRVLRRTVGQDK